MIVALSRQTNKYIGWIDGPARAAEGLVPRRASRRAVEEAVVGWLAASAKAATDSTALEALGWAHLLPELVERVSPETWDRLLQGLIDLAAEARAMDPRAAPLVHQLLAAELPYALAQRLPEVAACRRLQRPARRALAAGLKALVDREGLPRAESLDELRPLLASFTRCRAIQRSLAGDLPPGLVRLHDRLLRNAMRMARYDGRHVFCNGETGPWGVELFESALRQGGDENRQIAAMALPELPAIEPAAPSAPLPRLPSPAVHSEWASAAVLRCDWTRASHRLTVLYPQSTVTLELVAGGVVLCSGPWRPEIRLGGRACEPVSAWRSTCWASDADCDYLELELTFSGGVRLQRHFVLARKDRFLLLADAVLTDGPGGLEYRGLLPLAPGIRFDPAVETHEGRLLAKKGTVPICAKHPSGRSGKRGLSPFSASVLPLALPEWRDDRGVGRLTASPEGLALEQATEGRRLFAPLLVDLDPQRAGRPLTWRRLTVAQSLVAQPEDVAVGYRVAIGAQQWLIYRTLGAKANRTVLGHNLATETLVARFLRDGTVESIIEIE